MCSSDHSAGHAEGVEQMRTAILKLVQQVYDDASLPEHENRFAHYTDSQTGAEMAVQEILTLIKMVQVPSDGF
jgi:hypothetical protein